MSMFYPNHIALLGIIMQFIMFFLLLGIAVYVYTAIALMAIANKMKTKNSWFAWIPILNVVLLLRMAHLKWTWIFALLVVLIPKLGSALILAGTIYVWWLICKKMHRPEWMAILMIVPIVNLVMLGMLAWKK